MFKHENLKGRVAVVTGGGGVLCGGFAKDLARQGVKVAVLDLRLDAAQKIADEINAEGFEAIGVACNVLEKESLEAARAEINEKIGTCDILINGAGGNHPSGNTTKEKFQAGDLEATDDIKTFFDLDPKGIEFVFNLNFLGTLLPTQTFARDMAGKDDGVIINVSSMNSFRPLTKIPAYSGAKAAVSNFTQWLAVHFAPVGIRVNAIAPGFIVTEMTDNASNASRSLWLDMIPMRRGGKPEEVADVAVFLGSDMASYVSGQVIGCCGGLLP